MQEWFSDWDVFGIRIVAHFDEIYYFLDQERFSDFERPILICHDSDLQLILDGAFDCEVVFFRSIF